MKSIYIGVCKTREDERFKASLRSFTDSVCGSYAIGQEVVVNTFLPDAQNKIVKNFLDFKYDYLLLLDDDHWGHTSEMLECLIKADTFVATMKTYTRRYPYMCAAWERIEGNVMLPIENGTGYREVDLCGFPMTLIRRDTFDLLEQPYFRPLEAEGRQWNSDVDFFERLAKKGVRPVVCFQHCLNHDKITQENVFQCRNDERLENNNIAWFNILKERQAQGA